MDNLSTHAKKSLTDFYGHEVGTEIWDRFTVHYTPKHGSWLNPAEMEISLFSRQCLGKRRIADLKTLRQQAHAWNRRTNRERQQGQNNTRRPPLSRVGVMPLRGADIRVEQKARSLSCSCEQQSPSRAEKLLKGWPLPHFARA